MTLIVYKNKDKIFTGTKAQVKEFLRSRKDRDQLNITTNDNLKEKVTDHKQHTPKSFLTNLFRK